MSQVLDQAIIQYQGIWTPTEMMGANDIVQAVQTALAKDGFAVRNFSSSAGFTQNTWPFTLNLSGFNVTLTLQVMNGLGFSDPNDIISIVRHEVFVASGQFPAADSIPTVQNPSSIATSTGQPDITSNSNSNNSTGGFLSGLENLLGNTQLVIIGVGLGLIVAVMLIANPTKMIRR